MDANLLNRIMRLAERTGDRVIVVNPESGKAHAVIPFESYERMASGQASLMDLADGECECCFEEDEAVNGVLDEEDIAFIKREADKETAEPPESGGEKEVDVDVINKKLAEESQKISETAIPLDVLGDEEKDDEYYLEPIE